MPLTLPAITSKRAVVIGAASAVLVAAAGGAVYALNRDPQVSLDVDGVTRTVRSDAGTVGGLLSAQGVSIRADDTVQPAASTKITGGQKIVVRYAKPVTVVVDGKSTDDITHAVTVEGLLDELHVKPATGAFLSAQLTSKVQRNGQELVVSNPKKVTVVADGKKQQLDTTVPTVQQALAKAGVKVGKIDQVTPAADSYLTAHADVKVVRIKKVTTTETSEIKYDTTVQKDGSLYEGDSKVVAEGKSGEASSKVELTYADGKIIARKVISRSTVREPVDKVVKHGTKDKSEAVASSSSSSADSGSDNVSGGVWDRIAKCESGGNWHINTGNGYYGGLQFSLQTWQSVGGSGLPSNASKSEQIKRAEILQARSGWGQWSCASIVGVG